MLDIRMKNKHLRQLEDYRYSLFKEPQLRNLFLELTLRCNEHCLHCGSWCGDVKSEELTVEDYRRLLTEVKEDMTTDGKMLCITGGEPLLRKEFFDIMRIAAYRQFNKYIPANAPCCKTGRLKGGYGVEPIMHMLTGDNGYSESHNAVNDACDELKIVELLALPLDVYECARL